MVCACAFALPLTVAWVRDGSAESRTMLASSTTQVVVPVAAPLSHDASGHTIDAAHAASMMLVGTLLIGIGSMVRRGL
jgi:hypothetical protein